MLLIVARHCQTIVNALNKIQGQGSDFELTDLGFAQASVLKEQIYDQIVNRKIDIVYSSHKKRTIQTLKTIAPKTPVVFDHRLEAYDIGEAELKSFDDLSHIMRFPNPLVYKNMENFFGYLKRTKSALQDIIVNNEKKVVLVVTHEDVTAIIEKHLMKKSYLAVPKLGLDNGSYRVYNIIECNKEEVKNGDFSKMKIVKHEGKADEQNVQKELTKIIQATHAK